jgi:hypothetical protein
MTVRSYADIFVQGAAVCESTQARPGFKAQIQSIDATCTHKVQSILM